MLDEKLYGWTVPIQAVKEKKKRSWSYNYSYLIESHPYLA